MVRSLILFLAILAGCQSIPVPVENPRQLWCDTHTPRRDAREDTPDAEIEEIVTQNRLGAKWCGWKP